MQYDVLYQPLIRNFLICAFIHIYYFTPTERPQSTAGKTAKDKEKEKKKKQNAKAKKQAAAAEEHEPTEAFMQLAGAWIDAMIAHGGPLLANADKDCLQRLTFPSTLNSKERY